MIARYVSFKRSSGVMITDISLFQSSSIATGGGPVE